MAMVAATDLEYKTQKKRQDRKCTYNKTFRCTGATTVAVEKA
jgi:hypothetical protein